jgi:hypothetical protein
MYWSAEFTRGEIMARSGVDPCSVSVITRSRAVRRERYLVDEFGAAGY